MSEPIAKKCPKCGEQIPSDSHFCLYCMKRLEQKKPVKDKMIKQKRINKKQAIGIAICWLIGVLAMIQTLRSQHRN